MYFYLHHSVAVNNLITIDPAICNGRPVLRGTRMTVQTVIELWAAGDTVEDVLEEYPTLTCGDVLACMDWASRLMANHFEIAALA
jgi:uncharacterized protein (DUF433 family)